MIKVTRKGDFNKLEALLKKARDKDLTSILRKYGEMGLVELMKATPVRTGKTSLSWSYDIRETPTGYKIVWSNSNVQDYVNIAIILDTGHATRNGGWVEGRHYIEPALAPVFDNIAMAAWEEVSK